MTYSDQHYGKGDPDCPLCHGVGYIRYNVEETHQMFGQVFDCECRKHDANNSRAAHLRRVGGLEYLNEKTFETFNPQGVHEAYRGNLEAALQRAMEYAASPDGWLVMTGGYGCGKTHLAAAIANQQIEDGRRVLFVTVPDLLDHLRASFGYKSGSEESYDARFEEVRNCELLILDDLGIESPTPWANEKLYQLINYRYNARLPTVVTTNHQLADLEMRLRSRLMDLAVTETLHISAPDYRRGVATGGISDLNGLSLYSQHTLQSFVIRKDVSKEQRENLSRALEIATSFAAAPQGWLVFLGDYGAGKTHLAAAIANACQQRGKQVLFITVPDLLDHLRAAYAPNSSTSYDKRFAEVKTTPLLILDDLGTESATPWAREKLYQLFNHRYNANLPTVITTAHQLDDLDQRLVTRMRDKRICRIFAILAPAYLGERSA